MSAFSQFTVGRAWNPTEVFQTYGEGDERKSCVAFRVYDWMGRGTGDGSNVNDIRRKNAHDLALRIAAALNGDPGAPPV